MLRFALTIVLALTAAAPAANAITLNEATAGEFSNVFSAPTDFTGFSRIESTSTGTSDIEYFRFDSFFADTTRLTFTLGNLGAGTNMNIRLSSTPFTRPEWDWTITPLAPNQELFAHQWDPTESFEFLLPANFTGPLYGFARFYNTNSPSSLLITQDGTPPAAAVPLPASLVLLLAGLGGLVALRARRRAA